MIVAGGPVLLASAVPGAACSGLLAPGGAPPDGWPRRRPRTARARRRRRRRRAAPEGRGC